MTYWLVFIFWEELIYFVTNLELNIEISDGKINVGDFSTDSDELGAI